MTPSDESEFASETLLVDAFYDNADRLGRDIDHFEALARCLPPKQRLIAGIIVRELRQHAFGMRVIGGSRFDVDEIVAEAAEAGGSALLH